MSIYSKIQRFTQTVSEPFLRRLSRLADGVDSCAQSTMVIADSLSKLAQEDPPELVFLEVIIKSEREGKVDSTEGASGWLQERILSTSFQPARPGFTTTVKIEPQLEIKELRVSIEKPYVITDVKVGNESLTGAISVATRALGPMAVKHNINQRLYVDVYTP